MTRAIDAATIAELAKDDFNLATLIKLEFDTPLYITDWDRSLSILSSTWISSPHFISAGDVPETSELRVNSINLTLSGVEQSYISIFLSQDYIDKPIQFYRAVLDDSDSVIGAPILVFDGLMTGYEIDDTEDSSEIVINCASHWKDFEKENGRKTNDNSQKIHFPNDDGFEFAAKTIKDLKWGRK